MTSKMQEEKSLEEAVVFEIEEGYEVPDFIEFWRQEVNEILQMEDLALRKISFRILKSELECKRKLLNALIKETDTLCSFNIAGSSPN